jgi:hypothetical protein
VPGGAQVLDEHVIAEIPVNDPEYDVLFMTAMATARQRKAISETEEYAGTPARPLSPCS